MSLIQYAYSEETEICCGCHCETEHCQCYNYDDVEAIKRTRHLVDDSE